MESKYSWVVNAYASFKFIRAIKHAYSDSIAKYTLYFLLASPGIFYASQSFLPSAIAMTLVMLTLANYLYSASKLKSYSLAIFLGCLAVLWTGWPFVAVLFVPLGLGMLMNLYLDGGLMPIIRLVNIGVILLIAVGGLVTWIDISYYHKM